MPRILTDLRTDFRYRAGNITDRECSNAQVDSFLQEAATYFAGKFKYERRTAIDDFGLIENQFEYTMPLDIEEIIDVHWNGTQLPYSSVGEWRLRSIPYRNSTAGIPREIAVDGRQFIIYPKASADAITTAPKVEYRYTHSRAALTPEGIVGIPDSDVPTCVQYAAWLYLGTHPEGPGNQQRLQFLTASLATMLPDLDFRHAKSLLNDYRSRPVPDPQRTGAAR